MAVPTSRNASTPPVQTRAFFLPDFLDRVDLAPRRPVAGAPRPPARPPGPRSGVASPRPPRRPPRCPGTEARSSDDGVAPGASRRREAGAAPPREAEAPERAEAVGPEEGDPADGPDGVGVSPVEGVSRSS
ncbi:hypothetical protein GCM10020227_42220 [Streptomyces flavovirens]